MTALGFKAQFALYVELRTKRQSIRANASRFKVGHPVQLYTGMRTKNCRKLASEDPVCTSLQLITITRDFVAIDGWRLPSGDLSDLAMADGVPFGRGVLRLLPCRSGGVHRAPHQVGLAMISTFLAPVRINRAASRVELAALRCADAYARRLEAMRTKRRRRRHPRRD